MSLVFPRARLSVYNYLSEGGGSCVRAIVDCSRQYGLVSRGQLSNLHLPLEAAGCGSLYAARKILECCFEERGLGSDKSELSQLVEKTWSGIEQSINSYKVETALTHERPAGQQSDILQCTHMAPVVMDFLLQHLLPYI